MLQKVSSAMTNRINAVIFGKAGIGKTSLIKTLLGYEFIEKDQKWKKTSDSSLNICLLSAEAGLLSIKDIIDSGNIDIYQIEGHHDMAQAAQILDRKDSKEKYDWIIIDSLSELSEACASFYKKKFEKSANKFEQWDKYAEDLTTILKKFRNMLDYNVIFTSAEDISQDNEQRRFAAPSIVGKAVSNRLPYLFDFILQYTTIEGKRVLTTQQTKTTQSKKRSDSLPDICEPNLLTMYNYIFTN